MVNTLTEKQTQKKKHPFEIEDNLFGGVSPFSDEELEEVKRKLFPIDKIVK